MTETEMHFIEIDSTVENPFAYIYYAGDKSILFRFPFKRIPTMINSNNFSNSSTKASKLSKLCSQFPIPVAMN